MKRILCVASALVLLGVIDLRAASLYSVTDLGTGYAASSINNQGVITGTYSPGSITPGSRAFTYSDGRASLLGTLGGDYSGARAINNAGQVTGDSSPVSGTGSGTHAFLYSNGQMVDLGLGGSVGLSINDRSQIAGEFRLPSGYDHAFLYTGAGVQTIDLGTLGGAQSVAFGINNATEITGGADLTNGASHAFLYAAGKMTDLGTLGGSASVGNAINDSGQITGASTSASGAGQAFPYHAFLYRDGLMLDLGTLGTMYTDSQGNSINRLGQIVGYSSYYVPGNEAGSFVNTAFLYSNGTMENLNNLIDPTLGFTLGNALAINDSGQIIVSGRTRASSESFLLTPIPEPATVVLLAFGLLASTITFKVQKRLRQAKPCAQ